MRTTRTDLAVEAHALWREKPGETTKLPGVRATEETLHGFTAERVEILDETGEKALGKPRGLYLALDISALWRRDADSFSRAVTAVKELLAPMVPEKGSVLVAGLGNRAMTPDALGPGTADNLLVTRHLGEVLPMLRPVSALAAGVLGTTGMEAAEWVRGAAQRVRPQVIILVDALCAREPRRLCSTVQLSDTGLSPGSGVGNHRLALDRESLGVPVLSIGVPTVMDAGKLLEGERGSWFITPDSIDERVRCLSKVLGWGISLALQPELEWEDLAALME